MALGLKPLNLDFQTRSAFNSRQNTPRKKVGVQFLKSNRMDQFIEREVDHWILIPLGYRSPLSAEITVVNISGPRLLSELAEQTGGRAFSASDPNDLPNVAVRIGIELRNQYVLAYSPTNRKRDAKYRRVEVKVSKPPGIPNLKVHWRLGYYAPSQ